MNISYSITSCALGRVLVAATERGISAVFLGVDDDRLTAALRKEYPNAEILHSSGKKSEWVNAIVRHLAGSDPALDLPTDVVATAFQRRVWEALRNIPYGSTRTYSEMARALGRPKSTRAVARACATNPAAIVVPCHRVVRKDGSLGGYRWGLERKEQLLRQERAMGMRENTLEIKRKRASTS
jgi:AraC family transcriptional regulator of adaptative response/methylated-DNA-[protein]-cysteine methyltransferase